MNDDGTLSRLPLSSSAQSTAPPKKMIILGEFLFGIANRCWLADDQSRFLLLQAIVLLIIAFSHDGFSNHLLLCFLHHSCSSITGPAPEYRAVKTDFIPSADLPSDSCKRTGSCSASILVTGNNQSFVQRLSAKMFPSALTVNSSDILYSIANNVLGSDTLTQNFLEPAFFSNKPAYYLQSKCLSSSGFPVSFTSDV